MGGNGGGMGVHSNTYSHAQSYRPRKARLAQIVIPAS
jgi:hypothetical protein